MRIGIQIRLKVRFVIIITLVLAITGTYAHYNMKESLEARNKQLQQGINARLQIVLPSVLWSFDQAKAASILEAEMFPPEVRGIRVFVQEGGLFAGKFRDAAGQIRDVQADTEIDGTPVAMTLNFHDVSGNVTPVPVGRLVINYGRGQIDAVLREELVRKLLEILLLDLFLVGALSLSLGMVFKPLRKLREGLFDLATRSTEEVTELPEDRQDEFGAVVRGFNQIQRRLKTIIERTREAEEASRQAASQTTKAYEELREAQDSLLQAERLASLGGLVAGVAHEVNTPVGITMTSASVLHDATEKILQAVNAGAIKKSEIMNYLMTAEESSRLILANANRAANLIHSFKQIAADQTSEARRSFHLKEYISEIMVSLNPRLKRTNINININCPDELTVDSYPGAFAQILTNLTMNALSHAFNDDAVGHIQIDVAAQGDWIELKFTDDGKGIAPEYIDKVFDPFFTTKRGNGGTGLGLNIVFNLIVKQLHGSISVSSTLGHGASFNIRFPRIAPKIEA